jgi:hypothetical protein
MKKIVINSESGGFHLSHEAIVALAKCKGLKVSAFRYFFNKKPKFRRATVEDLKSGIGIHYIYGSQEPVFDLDEHPTFQWYSIDRDDFDLVCIVETMGENAQSSYCTLKIVEVPDDADWVLHTDDSGVEWIAERHRTWS